MLLDNLILKVINFKDSGTFGLKEKIFFFTQLSYLLEWWISIVDAINIIKDNSDNASIKYICQEIYLYLKKWESLNRSLIRLNKYFNDWDVNIIRSWEQSWELQKVLKYLAQEYEFLFTIKNKYIWAIMYPSIVFVIAFFAIFVIFKYILPNIIWILQQFDWVKIPFATKVLIMITNFISWYSTHILIILWLAIFGISILLSLEEWKRYIDKYILRMHIIWKITKYYFLIKFLRYMKLLIWAWMNYLEVFQSLKHIMTNSLYKDMIEEMLVNIRKWDSVSSVMENYPVIIPKDIMILMKVWEQTASTASSIQNWIWFYEQEFNKILDNLSKIIEPILIVFVWAIVAFIAISVFGIIWNILDSMQM